MDLDPAGARLHSFPRTISFGNWPFLVLLLIIAGLACVPMALDGKWTAVALIAGCVLVMPAFWAVLQVVLELVGKRAVDAVHEHGIVWRRVWMRGFIPWAELAKIQQFEDVVEGITFFHWELHERARGTGAIVLPDSANGAEAAELIASRISQR